MQRLLSITLISITANFVYTQERDIREHQGPQICGGRLKEPVGIIQTPNFPNPFPVPIKCRWIIEHEILNGTISIYFTQQYTTSGLTFTEYMYYDESYKLGERKALTVTEENITKNNWLQVQSPVLVVELTLNRLEGTQLRALGLLYVFGFNMTYMVKGPTDVPGPRSCSTIECRLLGHCYARHDYKEFYCNCFEGYSGVDCGVGPLCLKTPNMCKNGGTCGQMGPAAVSCFCTPGFTGDLCEAQIAEPECGIEECSEGCKAGVCDCSPKDSDVSSARFETRLQMMDQGNINISQEIIKQITNYLRACNITLHDEIEILNISAPEATGARTIWLRVWAERRDASALRNALARLTALRTRTDRLHLLPATLHFDMQPALSLHALIVNQRQEVWEGSEFILSCMAYGSPNITFTWYKDGVKINFNGTTRDIWTRTVVADALGRRMSVLGISEAKNPDSGKWSCSADDAGRRRCSALRLTILRPPDIQLVPSTLTVNKGDNVSITCLADASRMHGVLGFSWARERSLLPQAPGREVWEDLYPAGSVLKLYNIQKSGEFRCQVSSVAGKNTKGVTMWTLGPKDEACENETSHGLWWPKTSPGAHASATCPPGHNGESVRLCESKTIQHEVKWMVPDFSGCVADSLNDIYEQFTKISYGYSWGNISHVAHQYGAVLRSLPIQPGEGTLPLKHAKQMLHYLLSNAGKPKDRRESIEHLLIIYDMLLKHPDTFLDEEKIYDLQKALVDTAAMRDSLDNYYQEFSVMTKQVMEDGEAHFSFVSKPRPEEWLLKSAGVELVGRDGNTSVVVVQYRDLTARLPSLRRSIEINESVSRAGREMEYQLASSQTHVTLSSASRATQAVTTLLFVHLRNYTATASKLACAFRTASEPSVWVTTACKIHIPETTHVVCRCQGLGTFALFTVARTTLTDAEKDVRGIVKVTVGVGSTLCLAAAALQLLSLMPGRRTRLPVLLKAVTAGTHSAAVLILLECDTRQCGIEECSEGCKAGVCDCSPKDSDVSSARFETRLQMMDQGNINISQEIIKQITNYLRACNITLHDEIEILNISAPEATGARTIWLRVWAERRDASALRNALARLTALRTRTDRLHLLPATLHFDMQPALSLHALIVNQRQEVWEGSEFILSCMAYGSPNITFTWYKDGVKINFNGTTRDIWTRTVVADALGRRMSVLGISEAKNPDSGKWSCSADDAGRRRCSALRLTILRPPDIQLVPSTLTVNKGDNVSITCLADASRMHGVLGFSWARERSLLPQAPGREVWEDLYPAGSVLKLYNIQKSGEFRCQVSSVAGKNTKGVTMWTLGPKDEACENETSHGLWWPKTSPGAHASATCPPGHNGESVRLCESKTIQHEVKWMVPDFSGCVADSLNDIYEQFTKISYGYSWGNISHVAHQYGAVLRSLPIQPGEGTLPLKHAKQMLHYLLSNAGKPKDRRESIEHLLIIYDMLLKHPDTFLDEEKIYDLQKALVDTAAMRDSLDNYYQEFSVMTKQVMEDGEAHFSFVSKPRPEEWLLKSAGVELVGRDGNTSVVVVQYRDLTARLPSLRRSIEINESVSRAGREMEYQLASSQTHVTLSSASRATQAVTTLLFVHLRNYTATASKLACAFRTASEPSVWVTTACKIHIPETTHVVCRCQGLGTFALFTVARTTLTDAEKDVRGIVKVTVGVGSTLCLAAAALQLLSLMPGRRTRLPVLLKAVTAGTHSAAVLILLECDTRQKEACPGALGWVCAACWCAGCAALCAQPLLLQAELAGWRQRASSVALLAGLCTLAWLMARLWGGAPLQIGEAAQAVCAAGCAMLAVLCFVLAVCAALRLRTITHKVPSDLRTFLRDRGRVVRHSLAVLASTSAAQAAGIWWAQPGPRTLGHVLVLSAAALVNGVTMLVCYVIHDKECLQSVKRLLSLPSHCNWQESPVGDTSLSLYIKQGGEVESRGGIGMLESTSSQVSPITTYWRAPGPESPTRIQRRQSTPDTRADIVRSVEYKDSLLSPQLCDANVGGPHLGNSHMGTTHVSTTHALCDLIPRSHTASQRPEYMASVCLELGVLRTPLEPVIPPLTCSVDFEPYIGRLFDTYKDGCSICAHSNPDVSKIQNCLKKPKLDFSPSISLPSMELKEESKSKSGIEQVNKEWNKECEAPETDIMLNKISNDLDFLLNRTQDIKIVFDKIEEAPT